MTIIAHRSGPTVYPEQTIASAKLALEQGADLVEIDTRFTMDGAIAICHDCNAERVFGVEKEIDEMTAGEFHALHHKNAPDYGAHLLTEYLEAGISPLLIHVKEGGERLPELLQALSGWDGAYTLGLATAADIAFVKAYDKNIPVLAFMGKPEQMEACAEAGADYIRLWERWVTPERVDAIHAMDKKCWVMTGYGEGVGVPEDLSRLLALPLDGILINDITQI